MSSADIAHRGTSAVRSILATSTNMTVNSKSKEMLLQDPSLAWLGFQPGPLPSALLAVCDARC